MSSDVEELTIQYEENDEVKVEELERVVIQRGVWATVLFRYRDRNNKTGEWNKPKAALRRYRKMGGSYRKQDAVNISERSAPLLVAKLSEWFEV